MGSSKMVSARELVGRRIVGFEPGAVVESDDGTQRRVMHDPKITLDDGSVLVFSVEEHPAGGDYGVLIMRARVPKRAKAKA